MIDLNGLADLSAYAYLLIFALVAADVVLPVLPSESAVILGGALAWQGRLNVVSLVLVAAAGAVAGDHLSYALGRWTRRGSRPQRSNTRAARVQAWAAQQLDTRGASILLVARFVPGGRTASTFMSGRLHYPLSRFSSVTLVAGPLWAMFGAFLGYLGGTTFHEQTLLATGLGIGVGVCIAALVELWLSRRARGRAAEGVASAAADDDLAA